MEKGRKAKITSLVLSAVMVVLYCIDFNPRNVGLYSGCPLYSHLTYQFFHGSFAHLIVNIYCLLSYTFKNDVKTSLLVVSYIASIFIPATSDIPVIGFSSMCYFILGHHAVFAVNKKIYAFYCLLYISAGFIVPNIAVWTHAISFAYGLIYALANKPIYGRNRQDN